MTRTLIIHVGESFHPDQIGLIPSFLDPADPRPAVEQFDANYQHGGGWRPLPGFDRDGDIRFLRLINQ